MDVQCSNRHINEKSGLLRMKGTGHERHSSQIPAAAAEILICMLDVLVCCSLGR